MDSEAFFVHFQDYVAPKLDVYEQAFYLFIYRHTLLVGKQSDVFGFKSDRARLALGVGSVGTPIANGTIYKKIKSLESKGCITVLVSERNGQRIRLRLPTEIIPAAPDKPLKLDIESIDFFESHEGRLAILQRDAYKCFLPKNLERQQLCD